MASDIELTDATAIRREIRFAADRMLGGLARWLRLLGFDTVYLREGPGQPEPGRILLTRRSTRPHQPRLDRWDRIILQSNDTMSQLVEVAEKAGLTPRDIRPFTRCSLCNTMLDSASRQEVADRVPDYVHLTQRRFASCPECGRVYWPGTHHQRMFGPHVPDVAAAGVVGWPAGRRIHRQG